MSKTTRISRRELFRQAGRGAAGAGLVVGMPAIVPASVLGKEGDPPPSERIHLGFIGVGRQGNANMGPRLKRIVAVCDVDQAHLAAAKARVEKASGATCATYGDYRKLLENRDVDAVVITTPDHWHALPTIHACEAGKDVYCEKPLSLTVAEGRAMVRAARRSGRIVQTGSQQRSDDKFRLACELVRNGRLGKIRAIKVGLPGPNFSGPPVPDSAPPPQLDYPFWLGPAPQRPYNEKRVHYLFRFFWDYSGGQLTNFGAHDLDIVQWALGMDDSGPVSIEGTASYHKDGWYETPEKFHLVYTYADGTRVHCGQGLRGGVTFEGEKGTLWVARGKLESTPPELITTPLGETDVRLYASQSHLKNWLECIKSRKLPICDVEIGHRSATVCHLGNIAVRSGRKVLWDPQKEQIAGDREQQAMLARPYRKPWSLG